jgi:WS/DGAT/MGAT family acyltransferase
VEERGREGLARAVSELARIPLERDRPLWHATVLTGLDDGRMAVALKLHHALADGGSSARIITQLMDGGSRRAAAPDVDRPPRVKEMTLGAMRDLGRALRDLPRLTRRTTEAVSQGRAHNRASDTDAPSPFGAPASLYNRPLTPNRWWAFAELDMADLTAAKDAFGCSLNDVFLTICGGAMRRHLEHRDLLPDGALTTSIPVSVREDPDDERYGNRIGNMFTSLATDIADPVARLEEVTRQTTSAKAKFGARDASIESDWQELWPLWVVVAGIVPRVGRRLARRPAWNVITSNVRGPAELHLDGVPVEALHSMGPLIHDLGLNLTGWSYRNTMSVGVVACEEHVPDIWRLADGLGDELDALLRAAPLGAR